MKTKFPDSEFSFNAAQRIACLSSNDQLLRTYERKRFVVTAGVQNLGPIPNQKDLKPQVEDVAQIAAQYVAQLEQHPLDSEAREKLAVLYAAHYGRLDLAIFELCPLSDQPKQAAKSVARWLNL